MGQRKIIGAVEMGTGKVVALVGEVVDGRSLQILGKAEATSQGVQKGEIVDFKAACDAAHAAIHAAEKEARQEVESVYLALSGRHLGGFANVGSAMVRASDNEVRPPDLQRAVSHAKEKELPEGRCYVHHIKNGYRLDGHVLRNPLHNHGEHLEVSFWHVHAAESRVLQALQVINSFGVPVEDMIVSSLASACMVASDYEKNQGVLVVDIGQGTTDWVLYRGGYVIRTGVIAIGGDHLTNDLSLGLRIHPRYAEEVKRKYGKATLDEDDADEKVFAIGDLSIGDRQVPKRAIYTILNARLEELFTLLAREAGTHLKREHLTAGVVLTGGTSRLPRIATCARRILNVDTRAGQNPSWVDEALRPGEYSTALGLLYYGLKHQQRDDSEQAGQGIFTKVAKILSLT